MTPKERAAMQQALEALIEAKVVAERYQNAEKREQAITALREALAEQAEQEPVAEVVDESVYGNATMSWVISLPLPIGTKLYAAPVRTKDLTDAEIAALVQRHTIDGKIMPFSLCEAVIAADREKNK